MHLLVWSVISFACVHYKICSTNRCACFSSNHCCSLRSARACCNWDSRNCIILTRTFELSDWIYSSVLCALLFIMIVAIFVRRFKFAPLGFVGIVHCKSHTLIVWFLCLSIDSYNNTIKNERNDTDTILLHCSLIFSVHRNYNRYL